ncbi:MAG: chloride channel protein [Ignavibacteria bacterium]|nr:chloride channel protein [Ignavibacteria bacterium]
MNPESQPKHFLLRFLNYIGGVITAKTSSVKHAVLVISVFIGLVTGLIAVLLKVSVELLHTLVSNLLSTQNYYVYLTPLIGIILVILYVKYLQNGREFKGLSDIIHGIAKGKIQIPFARTYSHLITSTLTVGTGGSVGLEAPIAATGAAIGSNLAEALKFDTKIQSLFLACGTAGGISGIFNCPIAGVIFAVEVLFGELTISNLIPLLIASATASIVSQALFSERLFELHTGTWYFYALPFYGLLGIVGGVFTAGVIKSVAYIDRFFKKLGSQWKRFLIGGPALVILIILFFPLYGVGYSSIRSLVNKDYTSLLVNSHFLPSISTPWLVLYVVLAILLLKALAVGVTTGAGGDGGIIAPSLFMGAMLGFLFPHIGSLTGTVELNNVNFIAAGMAAVISGIVRAPLTAIFLIAEITGSYGLFVPLMVVSAVSYFTSRFFEPHTIYTKSLAEEGFGDPADKDENIISRINLNDLLELDFLPVAPNLTLRAFIRQVLQSKRNIFPVIDEQKHLLGVIYLDEIREHLLNTELYDMVLTSDIMKKPMYVISNQFNVNEIFHMFYESNLWNIPVVENCKYVGFVSKSRIFEHYRNELLKDIQPVV